MNIDVVVTMQTKLAELEQRLDQTERLMKRLKIDRQYVIERNTRIEPGIGCKVAYDYNGLVTGSTKLTSDDIPSLSLDKITGLKEALANKANVSDINRLNAMLRESSKHGKITETGCKVNVDSTGHVVSTAKLLPDDIPELPVSKITNLTAMINNQPSESYEHNQIRPNTGVKLSYDSEGHITGRSELTMMDLPAELLTRLNKLESVIPNLPTKSEINKVSQSVTKKLDVNPGIKPGSYTKVKVDSKGLIIDGSILSINDLPKLTINNITGLQQQLNSKADKSDIIRLNESIGLMANQLRKVGQVTNMKTDIDGKADRTELADIKRDVKELKQTLDRIIQSLPSDQLIADIKRTLKRIQA